MEKVKVSIIVPVYNTERYIRRTLDSLMAQTYKNIEVIIVDDGSTDKSPSIYDEYCRLDERFTSYRKDNEGLGKTRNFGMKYVSGDYVTFLDSDDWYSDNHISNMVSELDLTRLEDVVLGGCTYFSVTEEKKDAYIPRNNRTNRLDEIREKYLLPMIGPGKESRSELSVPMSVCFNLYKVSTIRNHKFEFYSEREVVGEDLFFNISMLAVAESVVAVPDSGYCYRMNPLSISHSYHPERLKRTDEFYPLLIKMVEKYNISDDRFFRSKRGSLTKYRALINMASNSNMPYHDKRKEVRAVLNSNVLLEVYKAFDMQCMRFSVWFTTLMMKWHIIDVVILLFKLRKRTKSRV